jgi:hypothetical protein
MRGYAEKVRTWRRDGFTLELFDTHNPTGRCILADTYLAYRFFDRGRVIFQGQGFAPPLGVCIDSDECVAACLFWFTLRPGDTDDEYFESYTPAQKRWVESGRAEELSIIVDEIECGEEDQ